MASPVATKQKEAVLEDVQLTGSGRPVLGSGEVDIALQPKSRISSDGGQSWSPDGEIALTAHRLIWLPSTNNTTTTTTHHAYGLRLATVARVQVVKEGGLFSKTPKLIISLKPSPTNPYASAAVVEVKVNSSHEALSEHINELLRTRPWEKIVDANMTIGEQLKASSPQPGSSSSSSFQGQGPQQHQMFSTSSAGISGLIRREDERHKEIDQTMSESFKDVDALMNKAKELVELAERMKNIRAREAASSPEQGEFNNVLLQIGIASPVTKDSAGSKFHAQLARQLSDFALSMMKRLGPIITLPDLYCLYNRARGTEMISPDDLYRACELLADLRLPIQLHRFSSGVLVVRAASLDDSEISKEILKLLQENGPLTPLDLSHLKKISLALAKEQCQIAEQMEMVVRDETFEGLTFYPNLLKEEAAKLPPRSS